MPQIMTGDVVRRGRGKTLFRVTGFWHTSDGQSMAALQPLTGYTSASAPLDTLTVVQAAEAGTR